jgi:lactoylglutathione lyase
MARIKRVAHVVLGVRDMQRSIKFYTEALGMEHIGTLDHEQMPMAFFSFGESDHDIAIMRVSDDQPVGSSALTHTALEIDGGEQELRQMYESLKKYGASIELTADHIISKSFYFQDPDGNRLEVFSQAIPSAEAKKKLGEIDKLEEALLPLSLEVTV